MTEDEEIRIKCLELAGSDFISLENPNGDNRAERAQNYYGFIKGKKSALKKKQKRTQKIRKA